VEAHVPGLREELALDLVIANGENVADGAGITGRLADRLLAAEIDCVTLGNHTWRRNGIGPYLIGSERVIRPANFLASLPGRGICIVPALDGTPVAVLNLLGGLTLQPARSAFELVDELVAEARAQTPFIILDLHGEATSEKVAMGWHLDGRVAGVLGTHTHVPTADARVLPQGTAFISDVGMTGSRTSVLGVKPELILESLITQMPVKFETAEEDVWVMGAVVDVNDKGLADSITPVMVPAPAGTP
jgi:metallophosphoesterase (TIGR00282 family)